MAGTRQIGFWDLVLYATAMNFGIRWLATAAAAGPASLPIWALAAIGFLAPLVIATAELASRFEGEGGVYAWTRETLGPFWGFLCGWIYWACNLPFFSGLLYFIVGVTAGAIGGEAGAALLHPAGVLSISIVLALIVGLLHARGLGAGKWLPNFGAAAACGLFLVLVGAAIALINARGSATDFATASYMPPLDGNGAILWSTMVFAFGGAEGVALLRNEVKGGMPRIVRALVLVGVFLAAAYILGSSAMLAIMPASEASRLSGLPDAIKLALEQVGLGALAPVALGLLALALLGGYSAWFGVAARLPFAAGVDRLLPSAFGHRDAKTGAPTTAIYMQTALVIVLLALAQTDATLKSAYDFLIAMSVLSYTLPFVFLFAAYLAAQSKPLPAGAWATPGGPGAARLIGALGLTVAASAIACTLVPSPDAPDPVGATVKLFIASAVLLLSGAAIYWAARLRRGET